MRLSPFIQHRRLGIISHTGSAPFVDNYARGFQSILCLRSLLARQNNSAHLVHDRLECLLHMFCLCNFLAVPLVVETQYRNTVFIHPCGVDFAVVILSCQSRTTPGHSNGGSIEATIILLQQRTISTTIPRFAILSCHHADSSRNPVQESISRHIQTTTVFYMIASWKTQLFIIFPPGRINMHTTYAIFIITFPI